MTSSSLVPRSKRALCSPNTQRMASAILLLPLPLGPTTAATPGGSSRVVRPANDLNPWRLRDFKNKGQCLLTARRQPLQPCAYVQAAVDPVCDRRLVAF